MDDFQSGAFWVLPELFGGCLPFTWVMTGPGSLTVATKDGEVASYVPPIDWASGCQNQSVIIRVTDRCGTEDVLTTDNCCEAGGDELSIGYTSLIMFCANSQQLSANGGCGGYIWSLAGGAGTLEQNGAYATYTAPDLNANCANNPTIVVTDCCGHSAQIKLAINCYTNPYLAMIYCGLSKVGTCTCVECYDTHCLTITFPASYSSSQYDCNGDLAEAPCAQDYTYGFTTSPYVEECIPSPNCSGIPPSKPCTYDSCVDYINEQEDCNALPFCSDCYGIPCNVLTDRRLGAAKAAGCCPINPFTGLPYD